MLFYFFLNYFKEICYSTLILLLILLACMLYTYIANQYRTPDDPKKKSYHPFASVLALFTFHIFITLAIILFVLRALLFAGFLVIFSILLLSLRKPFLFQLWHKFATSIGDPLLKANTYLIRMAFQPWESESQTI